MAVSLTIATVVYAPAAKADSEAAQAYAWEYGPAICSVLDDYPTFNGIIGIGKSITDNSSLDWSAAGEAVAIAVLDLCPRHTDLLRRFVMRFGPRQIA